MMISSSMQAQLLKFGIKAGANFSNLNGELERIDHKSIISYQAVLAAEIKLINNFSLQPELLYSTQGATIKFSDVTGVFRNEKTYISLPVMAKYYIISNSLSIEVGSQFSFLVSEKNRVKINDSKTFDFGIGGGICLNISKKYSLRQDTLLV